MLKKQPALETKEFKRIFGLNLYEYWDVYTGFDFIRFTDWLECDDNESARDRVTKKFGDAAAQLVLRLIRRA